MPVPAGPVPGAAARVGERRVVGGRRRRPLRSAAGEQLREVHAGTNLAPPAHMRSQTALVLPIGHLCACPARRRGRDARDGRRQRRRRRRGQRSGPARPGRPAARPSDALDSHTPRPDPPIRNPWTSTAIGVRSGRLRATRRERCASTGGRCARRPRPSSTTLAAARMGQSRDSNQPLTSLCRIYRAARVTAVGYRELIFVDAHSPGNPTAPAQVWTECSHGPTAVSPHAWNLTQA